MSKKFTVTIELTLPGEAGVKSVKEYVEDAVRCFGGGMHPESIFFGLERKDIQVSVKPVSAKKSR